jgi:hypothetical protein
LVVLGGDLVVASMQVLDEHVTRGDGAGGAVSLEAAHGSESGSEPAAVGFDWVVRVLLDPVQRLRDQLVEGAGRPVPGR